MSQGTLTFEELQARVEAAFPEDPELRSGKIERIGKRLMLFGFGVVLLGAFLTTYTAIGSTVVVIGLVIELGFGALFVGSAFLHILRSLKFGDRAGAHEFECDFCGYQQIAGWLRTFPQEELRSRLIFVSNRVEGLQRGTLFLWGSMEKIGFLPVIAALYLQFKDAKLTWPPDITLFGALLAFAVVLFYVLGLWAFNRKLQALRFERLLKMALDPDFTLKAPRLMTVEAGFPSPAAGPQTGQQPNATIFWL